MSRLPPGLAAAMTARILDAVGPEPRRVLEFGFAGIQAEPLRLAGHVVVVVEPDPAYRDRARERAGEVLAAAPRDLFDVVVAPAGADLTGVEAHKVILVGQDGSLWSSGSY